MSTPLNAAQALELAQRAEEAGNLAVAAKIRAAVAAMQPPVPAPVGPLVTQSVGRTQDAGVEGPVPMSQWQAIGHILFLVVKAVVIAMGALLLVVIALASLVDTSQDGRGRTMGSHGGPRWKGSPR